MTDPDEKPLAGERTGSTEGIDSIIDHLRNAAAEVLAAARAALVHAEGFMRDPSSAGPGAAKAKDGGGKVERIEVVVDAPPPSDPSPPEAGGAASSGPPT